MSTERLQALWKLYPPERGEAMIYMSGTKDVDTWNIEWGNPSSAVSLGESNGVYVVTGDTLDEAIEHLAIKLKEMMT